MDEFVSEVTYDENCKDCIYSLCDVCRNFLEDFQPQAEDDDILLKYHQCKTQDKRAEKVTITASFNVVFEDLRNQLPSFLVHRFIKRKQQVLFLKIIDECDSTALLTHKQVTSFTTHAWINKHVKESFTIIRSFES